MSHEIDPISIIFGTIARLAGRIIVVVIGLAMGVQIGMLIAAYWRPAITLEVALTAPIYFPMMAIFGISKLWGLIAYPIIFLVSVFYVLREVSNWNLILIIALQAGEACRLGLMEL